MQVDISLGSPVQRRPLRLILEQTHGLDVILAVSGESMINARGQNDQILSLQPDPDPLILIVADIEKTFSI